MFVHSTRGCLIGLSCAVLGLPLAAAAQPLTQEEVEVNYLVERNAFKLAVAGDMLTFEIHEDPACTLVMDSEIVTLGDPGLDIEQVRPKKVKGADKPLTPLRLRYVMNPTNASGRLFVRVTGNSVVPAGGACQVQKASIQEGVPDTLDVLICADGEVAKWNAPTAQWECASLSCTTVSQALAGVLTPFSATATCSAGTVLTGGGHSGLADDDTVRSSGPDGFNGWFCEVDAAAAVGTCEARCCSLN